MILPLLALLLEPPATPPAAALYLKARDNMAAVLAHQPNYTCVETIDRSHREKGKSKFVTADSIRLEVAYLEKKELYAWPGAKKFDETKLIDLIPDGAIATGSFAGHAQLLFRNHGATVRPGTWVEDHGKYYARYPFSVSAANSHYTLMRAATNSAAVPYSGFIWIDPDSALAFRIELHADEIPPALEIQATESIIEYAMVKIGDREHWLPSQSTESLTSKGETDRNLVRFSSCRAFAGESTLRFDDAEPVAEKATEPPLEIELTPHIRFDLELLAAIDLDRIHVGDLIPAALATNIEQKGTLLFPSGSPVELRLVRLQRGKSAAALEVSMGSVTGAGRTARLPAVPNGNERRPSRRESGHQPQISMAGYMRRPGLGTIYIEGGAKLIPKSYRSTWVTVEPVEAPAPDAVKEERH